MDEMTQFVSNLVGTILGNESEGLKYAQDPEGYLVASGAAEKDLSDVNYEQAFGEACSHIPGGAQAHASASASASAAGGSAHASAMATLEHHTNHYVQNVYNDNRVIIEHLEANTNISNTEITIEGDNSGDIDVTTQQANSDGDTDQLDVEGDLPAEVGKGTDKPKDPEKDPSYDPKTDPADSVDKQINTNASNTGIAVGGNNSGDIDVTTQQANSDGDVTQVDADFQFVEESPEGGYGGGASESLATPTSGPAPHGGHDDGGYGQGGTEVNTNVSNTEISVGGNNSGDIDATTQQANSDGDVTQVEADVEFPEPEPMPEPETIDSLATPMDEPDMDQTEGPDVLAGE